MKVCTYDNPATMQREYWQDGKLLRAYSFEVLPLLTKDPVTGEGPWYSGWLVGEPEAMERPEEHESPFCRRCGRELKAYVIPGSSRLLVDPCVHCERSKNVT